MTYALFRFLPNNSGWLGTMGGGVEVGSVYVRLVDLVHRSAHDALPLTVTPAFAEWVRRNAGKGGASIHPGDISASLSVSFHECHQVRLLSLFFFISLFFSSCYVYFLCVFPAIAITHLLFILCYLTLTLYSLLSHTYSLFFNAITQLLLILCCHTLSLNSLLSHSYS
jgi:hypothetical protein